MKNLSLLKKFSYITVVITILTIVIGYIILNNKKNNIEKEVLENTKVELKNLAESSIQSKLDVGISNAISISNDSMIKASLLENNRELAINALSNLSIKMKESTPF